VKKVPGKTNQFNKKSNLIEELGLSEYSFQPYFNGKNKAFFRKSVFTKKSDLINSCLNQKEILQRSMVNPFEFGKLTVFSNGNIFANPNKPKLGDIRNDTIPDIVYKELYNGKSWRSLRKNVPPCNGCVFSLLCPPLSSYEYVMKQYSLCHIYLPSKK
jgi:pseudo-rSAM protein